MAYSKSNAIAPKKMKLALLAAFTSSAADFAPAQIGSIKSCSYSWSTMNVFAKNL